MKLLVFSLSLLLTWGCTPKPEASIQAEFEALFAKAFSPGEPGGSILITKGDQIIFQGSYGLADLGTREKITEHTIFNTGSISKTFVSNGLLMLQEKGLLSIEDDLYTYFPDFKHKELAERITLKNLLSHTSGIPDLRKVSENREFYLSAKDVENFEPLKGADSLNFEAGERFQYSNPAYNGLALIIEQLSNQKWQTFIRENIFEPSGMTESKITDGPYPEKGVAHAYALEDGKYVENDYGEFPTFAAAGNGGIWCSVLDLAKYEQALQQHRFLGKELLEESRTVYVPTNWADTLDPFVGYSWFIGEKNLLGPESNLNVKIVYHTGSQGGFRAFHISIPEKGILYVALFNRPLEEYRDFMREGLAILNKHNWLE